MEASDCVRVEACPLLETEATVPLWSIWSLLDARAEPVAARLDCSGSYCQLQGGEEGRKAEGGTRCLFAWLLLFYLGVFADHSSDRPRNVSALCRVDSWFSNGSFRFALKAWRMQGLQCGPLWQEADIFSLFAVWRWQVFILWYFLRILSKGCQAPSPTCCHGTCVNPANPGVELRPKLSDSSSFLWRSVGALNSTYDDGFFSF